jgi:3-demethoxyubiquinol 3-hydroxylase
VSSTDEIAAMIRVDHAGEFGAVRIYKGQMAVLGDRRSKSSDAIRHMAEQEKVHLERFESLIEAPGVRPTILKPIWNAAGFALGAATALLGEKSAMACTEAVEEVIDRHYADQLVRLGDRDPELGETVAKFRAEEIAHREAAVAHGSTAAPAHGVLTGAIKAGCRLAIALSTRI